MKVEVGGVCLVLLPQRAAYVQHAQTLLVADAHIGKAMSFRKLGVPVPEATTAGTLQRLDQALAACGASHIVFLGDLLHSARGRAAATLAEVARWREQHASVELTLVRGNHDSHAGDPPANWRVHCVNEPLLLHGLALCHHPQEHEQAYVLAGHVHPSCVLSGRAHERLRLPCFHFGPRLGVLPAFGEFTGSHTLPRGPLDRVFVTTGAEVRAVPPVNLIA